VVLAALILACSNPKSANNEPTPRDNLLTFLNANLPDVDGTVEQGSDYAGLLGELARALEDGEAFVNYNLGTLDILLGVPAAHTTPGAGLDTLTLPGDDALAAGAGMDQYIGDIFDRWGNHESLYAGMVP